MRSGRDILIGNISFLLVCVALVATARPLWHWGRGAWLGYNARRIWRAAGDTDDYDPSDGQPIAWLKAETAGIDSIVLLGDSPANLSKAPCVCPDTGRLLVISAHRDRHFRTLRNLEETDRIDIEDHSGRQRTYRVAHIEIASPSDAAAAIRNQSENDRLLLMTCYPFRYIGPAPQRYLVWADPNTRYDKLARY